MFSKRFGLGLLMLCLVVPSIAATGADEDASVMGFGFGGPSLGVFLPDVSLVNSFLADSGYDPLTGLMITGGGRGRGGILGGISAGGLGWGGALEAGTADRSVSLAMGFGGVEIGHVAGGDERSLLTFGVVLGAGGVVLELRGPEPSPPPCPNQAPAGCVPTPTEYSMGRMFLAVEPFFSMQVQPFGILGFELHVGWLIPLIGFQWCDQPLMMDARPVLDLGGPCIGFSLTWGAIAAGPVADDSEATTRHVIPFAADCIEIDNPVGIITAVTSDAASVQTASATTVEVIVTRHARSAAVREQIAVDIGPGDCGLRIATEGPRRWGWSVDYKLLIPRGVELRITQGAGDVYLRDYDGSTMIDLGAGAVNIDGFSGEQLIVACGVGDVTAQRLDASTVAVDVGTGDVDIFLPPDASLAVHASAGIGEISIGPFAGAPGESTSGFGGDLDAILGAGAGSVTVDVGVGSVKILGEGD